MSQRPRLTWHRWEGVYSADFSLEGVRRRTRQLGELLRNRGWSCLVAHDTRFMGVQFARYAFRVLEQHGVAVSFCPTPATPPMIELALERRRFDCALLFSAGNRPHWFNGMHALVPLAGENPFDGQVQPLSEPTAPYFPPEPLPTSEATSVDLRTGYIETLRAQVDIDLIRRATLTLFVDPMNGATSGIVPTVLGEGTQTRAVEINREPDPLFNRQTPSPSEATMPRIRKLVKESDSHLGVGISADGRALGVTTNIGDLVPPLEIALLLGQHLARQHRLRGLVVVPQPEVLPPGLAAWEAATGQKIELAADPAARIAEIVAQDRGGLVAGITLAGEITIGRYSGSADAMVAALLLIELVAQNNAKLRTLTDELRAKLQGTNPS
ncbi:MAG: phosphoglucomutase [Roseiflexaceae bacterium]|nr:phosphoglucomutase [Roseiflexaceae bacterium]